MGDRNISPWRMWGSVETLTIQQTTVDVVGNLSSRVQADKQLSMIAYGRPETWLFFALKILEARNTGGTLSQIFGEFDLTIGVGRSQITLPIFKRFTASINLVAPGLPVPIFLYGTTAPQPTDVAVSVSGIYSTVIDPVPITEICSESIQVLGKLRLETSNTIPASPPIRVVAELHSYFAPKTHVRPEWFGNEDRGVWGKGTSVPRFPGGEDKGT